MGKNSLSHNLSTGDLLNVKTVAKRRNRPQWVRLPEKTYYEKMLFHTCRMKLKQ